MSSNPHPVWCHENDKNNTLLEGKIILFMGPLKIDHSKM